MHQTSTSSTQQQDRITNLDYLRGFATLGILGMNAMAYGLLKPAYNNLDSQGTDSVLDWIFGILGEVFIDQKTMAIFSMLFGAGIVLFADRAEAKGKKPFRLTIWRNFLLLVIGFLHMIVWEGDVLMVYGICAPVIYLLRKRPTKFLFSIGVLLFALTVLNGILTQSLVNDGSASLGDFWYASNPMSDEVAFWFISDAFCRALGAMLIGVGLYKSGFISGAKENSYYQRILIRCFVFGLPLTIFGILIQVAGDYSSDVAIIGQVPNTIATLPIAIGYVAIISLLNMRDDNAFKLRIRSVGQMALTNYLTQTIIGITVFAVLFEKSDMSRTGVWLFIICVWALQILWSKAWLSRFRFGPIEWVWRCATYRSLQPIRRSSSPNK
jgi:uncharacterized protein